MGGSVGGGEFQNINELLSKLNQINKLFQLHQKIQDKDKTSNENRSPPTSFILWKVTHPLLCIQNPYILYQPIQCRISPPYLGLPLKDPTKYHIHIRNKDIFLNNKASKTLSGWKTVKCVLIYNYHAYQDMFVIITYLSLRILCCTISC